MERRDGGFKSPPSCRGAPRESERSSCCASQAVVRPSEVNERRQKTANTARPTPRSEALRPATALIAFGEQHNYDFWRNSLSRASLTAAAASSRLGRHRCRPSCPPG